MAVTSTNVGREPGRTRHRSGRRKSRRGRRRRILRRALFGFAGLLLAYGSFQLISMLENIPVDSYGAPELSAMSLPLALVAICFAGGVGAVYVGMRFFSRGHRDTGVRA